MNNRYVKKLIFGASLTAVALMVFAGLRETVFVEYRVHQMRYRKELIKLAKTPEEKAAAKKYEIKSIPVLVAFGPDGKELVRKNGYQDPDAVLAFLEEAKGKLAR
jgi:thioredoxin-related protein